MKPTRDMHQRISYAERRVSLAIDRIVCSKSLDEGNRAIWWARAWAMSAGLLDAEKSFLNPEKKENI